MRNVLWAALAATPLILAGSAAAGDYHKDGTLYCSQCHVMHFSQSHGYNANGSGFYLGLMGSTPHHFLLRGEVNDLCLACHDNNGIAPDVYGASNTGNGPTDVRMAGYLNRLGDPNEAAGHTLDSTATAPGSTGAGWSNPDGLSCVNCHHQHGGSVSGSTSGQAGYSLYRNLRVTVGQAASNSTPVTYNYTSHGTNDLTRDVFERASAEYDEADVDWNEPNTADSAIAIWCGGCHGNFHGQVGSANVGGVPFGGGFEEFVRHPSAGVNIGAVGGGHSNLSLFNQHTNKVKVMSPTGVWGSTHPSDVTPTCISCHKAHGNGNAFGLIYRHGTGTLTDNGDSVGNQLEDLCGQCHVQGRWFFNNP
jgi:cytochrome c553